MPTITRENIDSYLDTGSIYAKANNGKWYKIRRNGVTKKWKTDEKRIRIPIKYGFRGHGAIDEGDFLQDGSLDANKFRHLEDVPAE